LSRALIAGRVFAAEWLRSNADAVVSAVALVAEVKGDVVVVTGDVAGVARTRRRNGHPAQSWVAWYKRA